MKRSLLAIITGFALVISVGLSFASPEQATAGATTSFSLTVSPASPAVGADFTVTVALTSLGPDGYVGYQTKLFYEDDVLDADGARMPASWNSAPVAGTGGNVAALPNGPDCGPAPGGNALQDNNVNGDTSEDDAGTNSILVFCNDNAVQAQSTLQNLIVFNFTCTADGVRSFSLANRLVDPQGGTFVVSDLFEPQGDTYGTANVTCGAGGAQPTATSTNTPGPTSTPTSTFTPGPAVPTNTPTPTLRPTKTPSRDDLVTTPTPRVTPDFATAVAGAPGAGGSTGGGGTGTTGGSPGGTITLPDTGMGAQDAMPANRGLAVMLLVGFSLIVGGATSIRVRAAGAGGHFNR